MPRLIDADTLKKVLQNDQRYNVKSFDKRYDNVGFSYDQVMFTIDKQPTIEAKPFVHGHWIVEDKFVPIVRADDDGSAIKTDFYNRVRVRCCSVCHNEPLIDDFSYALWEFCPWCGAKMNGGLT